MNPHQQQPFSCIIRLESRALHGGLLRPPQLIKARSITTNADNPRFSVAINNAVAPHVKDARPNMPFIFKHVCRIIHMEINVLHKGQQCYRWECWDQLLAKAAGWSLWERRKRKRKGGVGRQISSWNSSNRLKVNPPPPPHRHEGQEPNISAHTAHSLPVNSS